MAAEADSMLADDHIASWHDFYVAQVGASAAVAGLLVVAISINLEAILKKAWLIDRAAYSLTLIVGAFFIASTALFPISDRALQFLVPPVSIATWLVSCYFMAAHLKAVPRPPAEKYKSTLRSDLVALIVQALTLPSLIGAVLMLNGSGSGQYWIAAGVIIPFLVVFYTSWVLLIEILR